MFQNLRTKIAPRRRSSKRKSIQFVSNKTSSWITSTWEAHYPKWHNTILTNPESNPFWMCNLALPHNTDLYFNNNPIHIQLYHYLYFNILSVMISYKSSQNSYSSWWYSRLELSCSLQSNIQQLTSKLDLFYFDSFF